MNAVSEAKLALEHCEKALRKAAAIAASEGQYDGVSGIAAAAKAVSEALSLLVSPSLSGRPSIREEGQPRPLASSAVRSGYPRFEVADGDLTKFAWSKTDNAEYAHKAPTLLVDAVIDACDKAGRAGAIFGSDAVTNATYDAGASQYQGYVVLAWLRELGLLKAMGRKGYVLTKPASFKADALSARTRAKKVRSA